MMKQGYLLPETRRDIEESRPKLLERDPRFPKLVALWFLQSDLESGDPVSCLLERVDKLVRARGFVLSNGQLLQIPVLREDVDSRGVILDQGRSRLEVAERAWGPSQQAFFGIHNPYQMCEDGDSYTWNHVAAYIPEPYLYPEERIGAILHAREDGRYFYCPCHHASVVYTTKNRLVCMSCGAMHAVLADPLSVTFSRTLTACEWCDYFDEDGRLRDEEVILPVIDFKEVENREKIWTTDQWDEASDEVVFFSRAPQEEIDRYLATTASAEDLLDAGWQPMPTPPPPAEQVSPAGVDLDLIDNAARSLADGVAAFVAAKLEPDALARSVPELFRCIEMLLKARLVQLSAAGLDDHPNNPTVLRRLSHVGVRLTNSEHNTLQELRRLRNQLQHGAATFGYRKGLSLCRRCLILIDRFSWSELGLWIGDAVTDDHFQKLLRIPEIAATAATRAIARDPKPETEPGHSET